MDIPIVNIISNVIGFGYYPTSDDDFRRINHGSKPSRCQLVFYAAAAAASMLLMQLRKLLTVNSAAAIIGQQICREIYNRVYVLA